MVPASEEVISYFQKAGHVQEISPGELICLQGDCSPNLYLVSRGRVRMFFMGADGREITYQIIGEGQMFGQSAFLSHCARPASICAVTGVTLLSCQVQQLFRYFAQSQALSHAILTLLTENYQFLCGQVRRLGIYNRFQRVASYLLNQTERENAGVGILDGVLPYTHEELGVCLNLNRVTVTRVLHCFQEQGLVKLGRKKIQILDRTGLQRILQSP